MEEGEEGVEGVMVLVEEGEGEMVEGEGVMAAEEMVEEVEEMVEGEGVGGVMGDTGYNSKLAHYCMKNSHNSTKKISS